MPRRHFRGSCLALVVPRGLDHDHVVEAGEVVLGDALHVVADGDVLVVTVGYRFSKTAPALVDGGHHRIVERVEVVALIDNPLVGGDGGNRTAGHPDGIFIADVALPVRVAAYVRVVQGHLAGAAFEEVSTADDAGHLRPMLVDPSRGVVVHVMKAADEGEGLVALVELLVEGLWLVNGHLLAFAVVLVRVEGLVDPVDDVGS